MDGKLKWTKKDGDVETGKYKFIDGSTLEILTPEKSRLRIAVLTENKLIFAVPNGKLAEMDRIK